MNYLSFYNLLVRSFPAPELMFLNYGFAEDEAETNRWIVAKDSRHKYHISLVRHVLGDTNLAGTRVLEVGCGRGGNCYYLGRYTQASQICGLDACEANIGFCRRLQSLQKAHFLVGEAQELPFRDQSFDVVLNLESSHCYPELGAFLSEVRRVLVCGGVFCYADVWDFECFPYDWGQRLQALQSSGLECVYEEDISEPVFRALSSDEGFGEKIKSMEDSHNRELVAGLTDRLATVRSLLALGFLSYRLWRFRKPPLNRSADAFVVMPRRFQRLSPKGC